jgi:AraC family transcriptional regulator of adaptative response / DNA-3-methyladenine glycosylase II
MKRSHRGTAPGRSRQKAYHQAVQARDPRFDGKFFFGVKTTGIYCRPICPAKPKRQNIEFFESREDAEQAGYRPCLRCRPASAPRSPAWIGTKAVVRRAARMIEDRLVDGNWDDDAFAARFGVTARHLRRLFVVAMGKTPRQLWLERRLDEARELLAKSTLSIAQVALASGFGSIRRFNDAFKARFKATPTAVRDHAMKPKRRKKQ